jgi:acetyl-CoA acetyltransferase
MPEVYITGVAMTELGKLLEDSHELSVKACSEALRDAGLLPSQMEGVLSTPTGYMTEPRKFVSQKMADYLGIEGGLMGDVDCGGNSSALALKTAIDAIRERRIKSCLVFAAQREITPAKLRENPVENIRLIMNANALYDTYQGAYGIIGVIPFYAMAIQRYMHLYKVEAEDIARVAVVLRNHARHHPQAAYRHPLTVEEVLNSRIISPPIHKLESSMIMDGAAAVVLASQELVTDTAKAVRVAGIAEAHDATSFLPYQEELARFPSSERAAEMALSQSGYSIEDVDVAEVYGAFAGTEMMVYEELGFFPRGEAPAAVRDGRTTHGGDVLINPSGGRLSLGHPTYATPLLETTEVVRQLRGEAGKRQRPEAEVGLVHAEHGMMNGSLVMLLDRRGEEAGD